MKKWIDIEEVKFERSFYETMEKIYGGLSYDIRDLSPIHLLNKLHSKGVVPDSDENCSDISAEGAWVDETE